METFMNKKLYVQQLLDIKIDRELAYNMKTGSSNDEFTKNFIMPNRRYLSECKTTEDLIQFCKHIDSNYNEAFEESFCARYGLNYTGKLITKITLINHSTYMGQSWREVNDFDYLTDKQCFRINHNEVGRINFNKESIYFVDKKIFIHNENDAIEAVKHWKELKTKISIQNLSKDFINDYSRGIK